MTTRCSLLRLLLLAFFLLCPAFAWQPARVNVPEPAREFRAAWVATVFNLDWPSKAGLSAAAQKQELLNIITTAHKLKLNAIILQIRPNSDALYRSSLEPWSAWLNGPGVNPGYDPLSFAIAEAHKRGIEIHAWFNPFRATVSSRAVGKGHVSQRMPGSILKAGSMTMLNPSHGNAQAHVLKVIMDVVTRYDIDGVHLDDYFYPYPPHNKIADGKSPAQRRAAIDTFVQKMYSQIKSKKPWVRVGISPFGIWQPNYPTGIKAGVNAYEHLACDAKKWLERGWVDYMAPQLYWRIGTDQCYTKLMQWWANINPKRPVWPGIASQRINSSEDPGRPASEIGKQMDYSRSLARQSAGQLFWSWKSIGSNKGGVQTQLAARYKGIALTPPMPWSGSARPAAPSGVSMRNNGNGYALSWGTADKNTRKWVVQIRIGGNWFTACVLPSVQRTVNIPANWLQSATHVSIRGISGVGHSGAPAVLAR